MPAQKSDCTVLVVQEGRGRVVLFSAADPSGRTVVPVGDKPHEIELSPDGGTAYVSNFGLLEANLPEGTPGTAISVLDVARRAERGRFLLPPGFAAPHGLKLRPPRYTELFTNAERGSEGIVVFDSGTGCVLRAFPLPPGVHNFVFGPDGGALFAFTLAGEVCRVDPETGGIAARTRAGSPRGLAWTADARHLIVSGRDEILILDPESLSIERRMGNLGVGQVFYPAAVPGDRWILAPAVLDGAVLVIDAASGAVAHRVETGSPLLAAVAPGGRRAWISNVLVPPRMLGPDVPARPGGVVVLDLQTFETVEVPDLPDANGLAVG